MDKIIAHRGNTRGPVKEFENDPDYLLQAIKMGYDVEVDVWFNGERIYFGHDEAQYDVRPDQFNKILPHAWFHCKDLETLTHFLFHHQDDARFFWHQTDDFTLTNNNYIWTYPGKDVTQISIIVDNDLSSGVDYDKVYAVCTDYAELLG